MLGENPVVAFAATARPEASRQFYERLGLDLVADEPMALVFRGANATIRVAKTAAVDPPEYTVLGWTVDDVDAIVGDLAEAGIDLVRYDGVPQDDRGVATFEDGTRVAWFEDPDGNTLSVTEHPTA